MRNYRDFYQSFVLRHTNICLDYVKRLGGNAESAHDDIQYLRKSVFDLYEQKALPLYYAQARRPNANLK